MDSKASVFAGALQADPYPVRDAHPLRVVDVAFKALLKETKETENSWGMRYMIYSIEGAILRSDQH